jgi:hypothetical protein
MAYYVSYNLHGEFFMEKRVQTRVMTLGFYSFRNGSALLLLN